MSTLPMMQMYILCLSLSARAVLGCVEFFQGDGICLGHCKMKLFNGTSLAGNAIVSSRSWGAFEFLMDFDNMLGPRSDYSFLYGSCFAVHSFRANKTFQEVSCPQMQMESSSIEDLICCVNYEHKCIASMDDSRRQVDDQLAACSKGYTSETSGPEIFKESVKKLYQNDLMMGTNTTDGSSWSHTSFYALTDTKGAFSTLELLRMTRPWVMNIRPCIKFETLLVCEAGDEFEGEWTDALFNKARMVDRCNLFVIMGSLDFMCQSSKDCAKTMSFARAAFVGIFKSIFLVEASLKPICAVSTISTTIPYLSQIVNMNSTLITKKLYRLEIRTDPSRVENEMRWNFSKYLAQVLRRATEYQEQYCGCNRQDRNRSERHDMVHQYSPAVTCAEDWSLSSASVVIRLHLVGLVITLAFLLKATGSVITRSLKDADAVVIPAERTTCKAKVDSVFSLKIFISVLLIYMITYMPNTYAATVDQEPANVLVDGRRTTSTACFTDGTAKAAQKQSMLYGNFKNFYTLDAGDYFGVSVVALGDVDGDGSVDLAVGANIDGDGGSNAGAVYVLFLDTDGSIKDAQKLSMLYGNLNMFYTLEIGDWLGWSVAALGDLDGDNVVDLAVGAFKDDDGGTDAGAAYIIFLQTDGKTKDCQKISTLYGGLSSFYTLDAYDRFAISLSGFRDADGDGVVDLAVGADFDDDGGVNAGAAYIIYLQTDGSVKDAQKLSMQYGGLSIFYTLIASDSFGFDITAPGDIDGDGIEDLAVGTYGDGDGGSGTGAVYLLFLETNANVNSAQKLSALYGDISIFYTLTAGGQFGTSITALGDADGDGVKDLGVGARTDADGGADVGAVYITFLKTDGHAKNVQKLSALYGGLDTFYTLDVGVKFGISVAALGDVDGDGVGDLAVGAYLDNDGGTSTGALYVISLEQSYCETRNPSMLPMPNPSIVPMPSPTAIPMPIPTTLPVLNPTILPLPSPSVLPAPNPSLIPVPNPTLLPQSSPTVQPMPTPSALPVPSPTRAPAPSPTKLPVPIPTILPVPAPTKNPVPIPTTLPVPAPTKNPVPIPTTLPVPAPTKNPVPIPTTLPVPAPTKSPVPFPTILPVPAPTKSPVPMPTILPVPAPTKSPVPMPTTLPVPTPTQVPVPFPTSPPEPNPTKLPVPMPTSFPTPSPTVVPLTTPTDTVLKYTYYHDDPTCTGDSYLTVATDIGVDCSPNATSCGFNGDMYFTATCSSEAPSTLMPGKIGEASYSDTTCSSAAVQSATAYTKGMCFYDGAGTYAYATVSSSGDVKVYSSCSSSSCDDCVLSAAYSTTTCTSSTLGFDQSIGSCYHHTSTVTRLLAKGRGTGQVPLTDLAVGDRILAINNDARPIFAKIEKIPHGPSSEPFVHIAMAGRTKHELKATLHHTFEACVSKRNPFKHAIENFGPSVIQAKDLKAGDCLHTADGRRMVRKVKHIAPKNGDVTYSIKLAGDIGTVAIGGVFTHAMGQHAQMSSHGASTVDEFSYEARRPTKTKINRGNFHMELARAEGNVPA